MTTTGKRLRSYWGERQLDSEQLVSLAVRYWQVALIVALIGLAAGLRLWDLGERAIHHDESIHIKFAWDITQVGVGNYIHDPVYHGPFQYYGMAATFVLFGDSDYTSRLFPALFGIALVGLPFLLRKQLGTTGAFVAAGLLALSPALLYFSRFARNDMYIAFFTLATVICIWRYLAERRNGWLIAIAPLLALSFAAKEVTYITVAILLVFLNILLATELVQQLRASRAMTPLATAVAYAAAVPTAWLIVALWPVTEGLRKRFSLSEMPATGPLLIVFGTLVAAQFAAAIQKLPFITDNGYMGEGDVMRATVLVLIIGGAYVGLLWNWRVWPIAAALFYVPFVVLYTSFFTNMGGFWTGIWGSMDYWLQQQHVQRGSQPDYYYFMLLPVYEFLPLVFGLGGALYYAIRGKLEQTLLVVSALLLVVVFSVIPDNTPIDITLFGREFDIGEYRIQAAFVVAIGAVLLLSMDGFTKFLLFWALSILFGLTVAGEKMPWLTVHLALPLVLLAAKVLDGVLSPLALRAEAATTEANPAARSRRREPEERAEEKAPSPLERLLPLAIGAALALAAAGLFQEFGPASGISAVAWLLSLTAAAVVIWAAAKFSWRAAGQVAAVSLFAALLVFTVRAGVTVAFDQGNPDGYAPELFIYAQGSPKLGIIRDNIEQAARDSEPGKDLKIVIDNSGNIWPWPWYIRDYTNVEYNNFDEGYVPQEGSIVLVSMQNQVRMQPVLDQYHEGIPYKHMWWFPELYKGLETGDFLGELFRGDIFPTWRGYFIDRTVPGAAESPDMLAFFPKEYVVDVPPPSPGTPGIGKPLPAESVTIVGEIGEAPGQFSQPADLAVDAQGNLYVADTLNHRVQRIAPDGTIATLGESGSDPGQFANPQDQSSDFAADGPWGIGIDADGNIYVADTWNHRIQKFGPDFELIEGWEITDLFGPRDVAIDANGDLLVVDTGNKRILKYTTDAELIRVSGSAGDGPGEFNEPTSISIAPNGDIYVADFWNKRIQHFDPEFGYIDEISVPSWGGQGVTDRAYIVALPDGRVLATDPVSGRILVFDASGEEEAAWTITTDIGSSRPVGIAVDAAGQVYISDGLVSRVVWVPLTTLLEPQTP